MCDKIEGNLSQIVKEENQLYHRCIEINKENLRLQDKIKSMIELQEASNKAEEKITVYVKQLEDIVL